MNSSKIWTEEENDKREIENMIDHKGKSCKTCAWSLWEKDQEFVTCGHHYENFRSTSFCAFWTNPKDPKLLQSMKESKERIRARLKAKGLLK